MLTFIILLILLALVTIFSVQNAAPVMVSFLVWEYQASLAIVIFLCALTGILAGITFSSLIRVKKSRRERAERQTSGTDTKP